MVPVGRLTFKDHGDGFSSVIKTQDHGDGFSSVIKTQGKVQGKLQHAVPHTSEGPVACNNA